jgi:hypothetical protein
VSIRGGQVQRVCNFSRRRYVKSSRAVEYWLSIVPILPLLGLAVEKFCCAVLPDLFARFEPAENAGRKVAPARVAMVTALARRLDPKSVASVLGDRIDLVSRFTGDWLKQPGVTTEKAKLDRREMLGQRAETVTARVEEAGGSVVIEPYEPGRALAGVFNPTEVPARIAAGERVVLYQDKDGIVRSWAIAKAAPATTAPPSVDTRRIEDAEKAVREAADKLTTTRSEVVALREELQKVQRESTEALASRDREIATLRTESEKLSTEVRTIERLRADVELLKRR